MELPVTLTLVTGALGKAREDDGRNWIGKGEAYQSLGFTLQGEHPFMREV